MADNEPVNASGETTNEDFASLLEAQDKVDSRIRLDEKIEGTVISIGEEWVFVDVGGKSEGAISREELLNEQKELAVSVGDRITAYVINTSGEEIILSRKMTSGASEDAMRSAHRSGVPVEGTVTGERKGGYTVTVFAKPAFCPYSQMDLHPGNAEDYMNQKFSFRIIEYSDKGRNIVLSRRTLLEEEKAVKVEQLKQTLGVGNLIEGRITKLTPFGAFVDIGGTEGLIPISELAWFRVNQPSDVVGAGETVTVKVIDIDWTNNRISLSLKQTMDDPWASVSSRYQEGMVIKGTVSKLMQFGAFVELEPGVEGLIHISNLGAGRRINHPKEVVTEGEQVEAAIMSIDTAAKRIGLELKRVEEEVPLNEGDVFTGIVESVKDYGVFVSLPGGKTGLLHVSEVGEGRSGDLRARFPVNSEVQVQVIGIDTANKRVSLSTKRLLNRDEEIQYKDFSNQGSGKTSFGTFGDLLKGALKKDE